MCKNNFFVYIIESPSDEDILNIRQEGLALSEALKLADIPNVYNLVTTKNTFEISLYDNFLNALEKFPDRFPIFHFSAHGDEHHQGIYLTDETFISWQKLKEYLIPIFNEIEIVPICMSSCYSSRAYQLANDNDNPYLFLVANSQAVPWSDAAVGYITFYHLLSKLGIDQLDKCFDGLKIASGNEDFRLYSGDKVKERYKKLKELINQYNIKKRIKTLIEQKKY